MLPRVPPLCRDPISPLTLCQSQPFVRYKYLQRPLEETTLPNLLQYLNRWPEEHREKIAVAIGLLMAQGLASASCLQSLTKDHLVKNGTSLSLASLFTC